MATILIVDDSNFIRKTLSRILEETNHELLEAANGQEALEVINSKKPDCMILDLLMPVMDGVATLQTLKEKGLTIPVIILSADIQESVREECFNLGVKDFLNKPPHKDKLFGAIDKAIS